MTGTTASITVSAKLPGLAALPSLLTVGAPSVMPGAAPGATPTLAAFVDLMMGKQVAPQGEQPAEKRQDDAATGNSLPDKDESRADPALAWLFSAVPIVLPTPRPVAVAATPVAGGVKVDVDAKTGVDTSTVVGPTIKLPVAADVPQSVASQIATPQTAPSPRTATPIHVAVADLSSPLAVAPAAQPATGVAVPLPAAKIVLPAGAEIVPPVAIAAAAVAGVSTNIPPVFADPAFSPAAIPTADRPARDAVAAPTAQPIRAAVPLAQAIAPTLAPTLVANAPMPALFALAGLRERDGKTDTDATASLTAAAGATLLQPADAAQLIAKPGGAQGQALDMGRQDWPQKMIDRIETLRDDANANDTSIRLKPEALGRVDVSLRTHADGAVSVRFAAEQPATRTMLADAQPQLQAAAEARGIRLSGTSVDLSGSGAGGNTERQQPRFELQQGTSNHLAAGGEDIEAVGDGRIA